LSGFSTHRPLPVASRPRPRNLLVRLHDHDDQVLLFARDLTVPCQLPGRRDLRSAKTERKISNCHRSEKSARAWIRQRGYISTTGQQATKSWTRAPSPATLDIRRYP
jgi:hypothetical protein